MSMQQDYEKECIEQTKYRIIHPLLVSEPYPAAQSAKFHQRKEQVLEA